MGFWEDNTVEVTYNGKTTRVSKQDAHLYESNKEKVKEPKPKKQE